MAKPKSLNLAVAKNGGIIGVIVDEPMSPPPAISPPAKMAKPKSLNVKVANNGSIIVSLIIATLQHRCAATMFNRACSCTQHFDVPCLCATLCT
jgi:hypothetical protein